MEETKKMQLPENIETLATDYFNSKMEKGEGFEMTPGWRKRFKEIYLIALESQNAGEQKRITYDIIERIRNMKDDSGRRDCTYGDSIYDSLSACYGYNLAVDNIADFLVSELSEPTNDKDNAYEYEMFFESKETDAYKIDGWYPIATDRIRDLSKIDQYIKNGLLRKIK